MSIRLSCLLIIFAATNCRGQAIESFRPNFKPTKKTTHKIAKDQQFTFGYLEVLENRNRPGSQTIKLPVYIFKSRSENPKPDPIIYTVGGPGSSTMSSAQYMNYYKYLDDRDFILIEQRGTYYAKPHLACPEWAAAIQQSNLEQLSAEASNQLFAKAATDCRARLIKNNIDLDGYNTNESAADINDLVKVLGIEEYNLLTISYSTKIAQVLLRDYPERIRSVVMDSPLPLEVNYDEESVKNLLTALEDLLDDCALDPSCSSAYPDLKQRFLNYLKEKTVDPLSVVVKNPKTEEMESFYLTGADLITVFSSASTYTVAEVPFEINKLLNGDLSTVNKRLASLFQSPGEGAGMGMRLSVWCAEEHPFNDQEVISNESNKYPAVKGLSPAVFSEEVCNIWRVKPEKARENLAITTNTPVLLISGEFDHDTPVKWAQAMTTNLPNSFHFVFKGWKHIATTNWSDQCAMEVANDFFNNPRSKPTTDCFSALAPLKFKLP